MARVGVGAGEAALNPAAYSLLSDFFPRERVSSALVYFNAGSFFGNKISYLLGGLAIAAAGTGASMPIVGSLRPWQLAFLIVSLPGILVTPLIYLVNEPVRRGARMANGGSFADAFAFIRERSVLFLCLFVGFSAMLLLAYGALAWLPSYFIRVHGMSAAHVSFLLALLFIPGVLAMVLSGQVVDWGMRSRVFDIHFVYCGCAALICTVAGASAFLLPTIGWAFAVYMPVQGALLISPLGAAVIQIISPNELRGKLSSIFLLTTVIGLAAGPSAVAFLTQFVLHDPRRIGLSLSICFAIFGSLAALSFFLGRKSLIEAILSAEAWLPKVV
jgi:MFS family permease